MATYYSHMLNRAISYDKNLITPQEIQEIIDFIFENDCSKYRIDYAHGNLLEYEKENHIFLFLKKWDFINKKEKYIYKMWERIEKMFWKAEIGEK